MRNGKRYRTFFQIPFPLRKRNCWERPDHLPFFRKRTDAVLHKYPPAEKPLLSSVRTIAGYRAGASPPAFFIESPRSLPASGETSVTGAGGTCPGAEKPRRASSPTPVNTEKRFPGSHRHLSSEAMRQQTLLPRNRRYGNKNGKCPGFLKGRQPLPPRHRFRKFAWPRKKPSLSPASLSGALYLGLYKNA